MKKAGRELTAKELEITKHLADGMKNFEIANAIGINECAVKNSLKSIFDRRGMNNRTELALWYVARYEPSEQSAN